MKKFLNHRVLPFVCVLSILVSFMVVPASAGFGGSVDAELPTIDPVAFFDKDLMVSEMNRLFGDNSNDRCAFFSEFAYIVNKDNWTETSRDALVELAFHWNSTLGPQYSSTASVDTHRLDDGTEISYVRVSINDSRLGGSRNNWTWCLNDGAGKILVDLPDIEKTIVNRGQWLPLNQTSNSRVEMKPYDEMFNAAKDLGCSLYRVGNYWVIKKTGGIAEYIFCNEVGERFVAPYDEDMWATGQDRPDESVTVNGENVEVVEGNQTNLDLSGMTIMLPDGTINLIDKIIYDESTKSYHIDSHDTYNYITNNYYTWNYYINYTSITYIGQTEEYNKYYEVYYELPDGRSSADLTKEDLEQLNLSVDVIPYGRSADDTSLRSLYHFDGDTKDSSYWNYCTDFTWNKGASLTYMDAGVFDGALYLDENEHDFTLTLPSNITSLDFTLQFRYYQSATPAPQTDSYLKIGGSTVLQFTGGALLNASGSSLANIPVGAWNEIAVIRSNGTIYYYLNGVSIGSVGFSSALSDTVNFHFGSAQQTFKYFDELRFLNYALVQSGVNYTPSGVPHDTNLTLVLPTDFVPIADEYWSFEGSKTNLLSAYGLDDWSDGDISNLTHIKTLGTSLTESVRTGSTYGFFFDVATLYNSNYQYPNFYCWNQFSSLTVRDDHAFIQTPNAVTVQNNAVDPFKTKVKRDYSTSFKMHTMPTGGLCSLVAYKPYGSNAETPVYNLNSGSYTLSMVSASGDVGSVTFTIPSLTSASSAGDPPADTYTYKDFNGYRLGFMRTYVRTSNSSTAYNPFCFIFIQPLSYGTQNPFIYLELVNSSSTDLNAEKIESVTIMDKADLNTPTLAVRTDIDITSYQIGGVRPSIPEKGQVWAMVENDRIVSIQIYNGQAWEGVDGRIWTGQRWIPASSYNIITLQDMYDIVDATPNYEYIYSEAGFWAWWQKSWNAFQEKLFQALGSGGSGGGSIVPGTVKQKVSEALSSLIEGIFGTITEVLKSLIGAAQDLLSGIFSFFSDTVFGGIRDFFSSFDELINPFETTIENEDGSTTTAPGLPDDVVTGLGFFSGLIMLIPDEVRVVLFFFAGLTLFIAILKRFA